MKSHTIIYLFIAILSLFGCQNNSKIEQNTNIADVIVYGGTATAVTTAVQLTRMGKSVLVVSPDVHLGGLTSSGLGFTDTGDKSVIGGLAREFYQGIYNYYQKEETWKWQAKEDYGNKGQGTPAIDGENKTMWIFEPSIAEKVFNDFLKVNNIKVIYDEWLDRENGVEIENGEILSFTTLSGQKYIGKVFIDATYEGDLMAASGVSYHVGREAQTVYNEDLNGVQLDRFYAHHFGDRKISPYVIPGDSSSGLLARISSEDPGKLGAGDHRVQAYCFRTCLTKNENNRVPFEKPEVYDSTQYELLIRIFDSGWRDTFKKFDPIPNFKTDVNNRGPFSFDNIGMNYDYPEASYEERVEIIKEHEVYQKGLLYFIATDPRVPEEIQEEMNKWGLAKDEFMDNGNWPHQIYVREARRMIGEFVMTQNEIERKKDVLDPIGMGSYNMDSHNTQRYITSEGFVQNEGDVEEGLDDPYQICLGSILPKKEECSNLLVPVAVSSSHIAFGSIRMEPVFMILGQSAGTIAALALEKNIGIHDLSYDEIKAKLIEDGQVLEPPLSF